MKFNFLSSEEFYKVLYKNDEFCAALGKVMLAAGQLESELLKYLVARGFTNLGKRATLGKMVYEMKNNEILTPNGEMHYNDLTLKRNYLAHNIYKLFSNEIEETILPREELSEGDVDYFHQAAAVLADDFLHFATSVQQSNPANEKLL